MPKQTSGQCWRVPAVPRVKFFLGYAAYAALAVVFFPRWLGLPLGALLAAWAVSLSACGGSVRVDEEAGLLTLRLGWIIRRVRLAEVTGVLVDTTKVTIRKATGTEISFYAWRRGPLDALLRVPVAAGDIGHAIARAVALAQARTEAAAGGGPVRAGRSAVAAGTAAGTRSRLATVLLAVWGALAIGGALLVRVHWNSPVLTVLGVLIALGLGFTGLLSLLLAGWLLLTGRAPRIVASS